MKVEKLGTFTITMMNVAAIASLRNLPIAASYGHFSLVCYAFAAFFFFLPISFSCMYLSSRIDGGIYRWVSAAMGKRMGLVAVWLQWFENAVWYPTILSFAITNFLLPLFPSLAHSPTVLLFSIVALFWVCSLLHLLGARAMGWMTSLAVLCGTVIPFITLLSLSWVQLPWMSSLTEPHTMSDYASSYSLSMGDWSTWTAMAGVSLSFAGMELSDAHYNHVRDPKRTIPRSIIYSTFLILCIYVVGTLALLSILPPEQIQVLSGLTEAVGVALTKAGWSIHWQPLFALLLSIGALATVFTWTIGPTQGLFLAAKEGILPARLAQTTKKEVPSTLLLFQGVCVTLFTVAYSMSGSLEEGFWWLVIIASQSCLAMYVLLFIAALLLQASRWEQMVAWVGLITTIAIFVLGCIPPPRIGHTYAWPLIVVGSIVLSCFIPLMVCKERRS